MSIHDETWDRPICDWCHVKIGYGENLWHADGFCLTQGNPHLERHNMKNTVTSSTELTATLEQSANDILNLFDRTGFTTDEQIQKGRMKHEILLILKQNILGNTNYNEQTS